MRVLFTTNPAEGHFYPMVPLAWALRAAGAEVLVAAPESFAAEVTQAGLPTLASCGSLDMIETMRPDDGDGPPRQAPTPEEVRWNTARGFAKLAVLALPGTLDAIASWRPDLVVTESAALVGPVAASRSGVPYLEHRWGLAIRPELAAIAVDELSAMSGGEHPAPPAGVLDVCPPSFQYEDVPRGMQCRYIPYNGLAVLPEWAGRPRSRRRVCLTLGTVLPRYGQVTPLLDLALAALSELDVEVVVAMRPQDRARLDHQDRLPNELRTASWLPLNVILPECDAVVHHGGSGTTMTSLVHGLPQVALPHFADQFANAERIGRVGVGTALSLDRVDEEMLTRSVAAVLDEHRYRSAAAKLAVEIAGQPTPADAVAFVRRVAGTRPGPVGRRTRGEDRMRTRLLGQGLRTSAIGLGCVGMSGGYGAEDVDSCVATVRRAVDLGLTLIDTADFYGGGEGEKLLGRALGGRRDEVVLSVKTGIRANPEGGMMLDGAPEHLRRSCDESLRRLDTDHIDLYCLAWIDPAVPVEESVGALSELVTAGKVRHLALSEVAPDTLRRAHAIHPIAAVATEYSLWQRHSETDILSVLSELDVGLLAYASLGRGFLTGTVRSLAELDKGDWRNNFPRFADENIGRNLDLLVPVRSLAEAKGVSPARLALAWLLTRGERIVPLVGCKTVAHIEDDVAADGLPLTEADIAVLDASFPAGQVAGQRYPPQIAELIDA